MPLSVTVHPTSGPDVTFRPLAVGDAAILGRYFLGLSADTRQRYGPHPFDQATAAALCASLDDTQTLRLIATIGAGSREEVIAYIILALGASDSERERYARAGILLDPVTDCAVAPSVADAYQNRGLGTLLMRQLLPIARSLGCRRMLLTGGVYASNERAVHFYKKLGFRTIGRFENRPGIWSYDMIVDL